MRTSIFARSLFLLLILASPVLVLAQFQQPTAEELKMTADPKAPGAAAVYLNIEEIANDPLHYQSYYARIKVLSEKGKELATVELPYLRNGFKITNIEGSHHSPRRHGHSARRKAEDLLIAKKKSKHGDSFQVNQKVFTLPSVEVGSILEYRYQFRYDDNQLLLANLGGPASLLRPPGSLRLYALQGIFARYSEPDQFVSDRCARARLNTLIWWPSLPNNTPIKADAMGRYTLS
jgi:hypothetical protein